MTTFKAAVPNFLGTDINQGGPVENRILADLSDKEALYQEWSNRESSHGNQSAKEPDNRTEVTKENVKHFDNFDGIFDEFNGVVSGTDLQNRAERDWVQESLGWFDDDEICGEVFLYKRIDNYGRKTSTFGSFSKNGCLNRPVFIATWESE